jgi:hypothetical protein
MYSLARKGRVIGLQCMIVLIFKQMHSVSYKVSGMSHGSSYSNCGYIYIFVGGGNFHSFLKGSL